MPPLMITGVMPIASRPMKQKFCSTLPRLLSVAKCGESCETTRPITSTEAVIQISCVRSVRRHRLLSRRSATSSSDAAPGSISAS